MGNYFSTNNDNVNHVPGIYLYKTLDIVKMVKCIESCHNVDKGAMEDFLNLCPISSNYLIQWKLYQQRSWISSFCKNLDHIDNDEDKLIGQVIDVYPRIGRSTTPIRDHIVINGLTERCVIGLTSNQKQQLDRLIQYVNDTDMIPRFI